MSDQEARNAREEDIDKEILSLLEGTQDKSKRKNKKKKTDYSDSSDNDSFLSVDSHSNSSDKSFKVTKKKATKNDNDYEDNKMKNLTEIEREQMIADKEEKRQKQYEKQELQSRLNKYGKNEEYKSEESSEDNSDEEYGALKRPTRTRKKTSSALKEIKEKRRTRKTKKYESSDEDSFNEDEIRGYKEASPVVIDESPVIKDVRELYPAMLRRQDLIDYVHHPWFVKTIIGCYVSVTFEETTKDNEQEKVQGYRMGKIVDVIEGEQPYQLENVWTHKLIVLAHGKATKVFKMNVVSNKEPLVKEFKRLQQADAIDNILPITQNIVNERNIAVNEMKDKPKTDEDFEFTLRSKVKSTNDYNLLITFISFLDTSIKTANRNLELDKAEKLKEEKRLIEIRLEPYEEELKKQEVIKAKVRAEEEEKQAKMRQKVANKYKKLKARKEFEYDSDDMFGKTTCFSRAKKVEYEELKVAKRAVEDKIPKEIDSSWKSMSALNRPLNIHEEVMLDAYKKFKQN